MSGVGVARREKREALAATFDEDAELYDRVRPGYPPELLSELAELAHLGPGTRVLEIGPGTGQATRALAGTGAEVVAIERGAALARVARRRLAGTPGVKLVNAAFEDWRLPATPFDVVAAFTAWHWLDPEVRTSKVAAALRPGGALVTVATHHVAGGTEPFFADVQRCYERWDPATPPGLRLSPADAVAPDRDEVERGPDFEPPVFRRYEWEGSYTTAGYLDLLRSYSGHRHLGPERREALLACIGELIDRDHEGRVVKRYLNELRVARRREEG